jgi:hypothetical protein
MWALPISAQSIFIIPRAGLNLSTITQTGGSLRSGLNFGVSGEYLHNSHIAAEIGMSYSMQGSYFKSADISPEHNYLNIPFLFKYYVKGLEKVEGEDKGHKGFNVFAGPQLDLKMVVNKVGYTDERVNTILSDDMTQSMGASFVLGGEYLFDNGLVVSINLNYGLTNKAKKHFIDNGVPFTVIKSYRDFVAQFKFGYRFAVH